MISVKPAYPSREFYELHPRSAKLREVCLTAILVQEAILEGEEPTTGDINLLLDTDLELRGLGITPKMHEMKPDDPDRETKKARLREDPVMAAEWVAGQLLDLFRSYPNLTAISIEDIVTAVQEQDELLGEGGIFPVLNSASLTPKQADFYKARVALASIGGFFGREREITK